MAQRPTVLLLIPHLGGGGAERVIELLARNLPRERYDIQLGLITQASPGATYLPSHIAVHALGAKRVRSATVSLLRLIHGVRPDLILSGIVHLNFLLLFLRPLLPRTTRVLVRQSGTASAMLRSDALPSWAFAAYWLLYRKADGIICQSQAMADDLRRSAKVSRELLHVLPNPVDFNQTVPDSQFWSGAGPHLLAVGRLSHEKGFDLLLQALTEVRRSYGSVELAVAGTGPEERTLRGLSGSLGLSGSVHFLGHVPAPADYYPGASLFVLPSRQEGIPNALLEAAAGGLPIVATPASAGLVALLHGQSGIWLAREVSSGALAESLLAALSLGLGQRFHHRWVEPFSLQNAIAPWMKLIDSTLATACHCTA
jgi:glycosyltransferase involved in cell wall biosynthesis